MPALSPHGQPDTPGVWFLSAAGDAILDSEHDAILQALAQHPAQPWLWLAPQQPLVQAEGGTRGLALGIADGGWRGAIRCATPLPMASESFGLVVLQHVATGDAPGAHLLQECARILVPGGRLLLFALNPLSAFRLRWRGSGLRAQEPVTWRRRLRAAGLTPHAVSQGIGPQWSVAASQAFQDGPGLRAAYLLRAEKRTIPLTPLRSRQPMALNEGLPAA